MNHSKFYYIDAVVDNNFYINFLEPNAANEELTGQVALGQYSPTELAIAVENALNNAGTLTYNVSFIRLENKYEISADDDFILLTQSGSNVGVSVYGLIGFDLDADKDATDSIKSDNEVSYIFRPQFFLQDYVPSRFNKSAVSGTQVVSASGVVEVVSFGLQKKVEFNIRYQNNLALSEGGGIRGSSVGLDDLEHFCDFIITKAPVEFMVDEMNVSQFETLILEAMPGFSDGLGYRLREMTGENLSGYYETGVMIFRVKG